jgi:hypothetical protein
MNHVLFFTACDANFFELFIDLITSIKAARGEMPRMCVFDVGLRPQQLAELKRHVDRVIQPAWDLPKKDSYPPWFRAMTSRPFLPNYAIDAEIVVWMDCDTWVQSWRPLENLIQAARDGALAIVEEQFGAGFTATMQTPTGPKIARYNSEGLKANLRRCYERCFGREIADAYSDLPSFNSGVFALRTNSPTWATWRDTVASGLQGLGDGFHMLVEQQALSIAIRQGRVPVALQPLEANFVCVHELPWFDPASHKFTLPRKQDSPLGVVHLTDAKYYQLLPIPNFPLGHVSLMSLLFRDLEMRKSLSDKQIRRNDLCPCGSGRRYKHCHGRLS